ncbi:MAG: DnaJ domain-containing protein [Acidimicrobiia bacterium]|nr:DnaJ domain-containing protein [Acidimicrobiia bacterium]
MASSTGTIGDYYRLLGISSDATLGEIKAAYQDRVRLYHPDLVAGILTLIAVIVAPILGLVVIAVLIRPLRFRRQVTYDMEGVCPPGANDALRGLA